MHYMHIEYHDRNERLMAGLSSPDLCCTHHASNAIFGHPPALGPQFLSYPGTAVGLSAVFKNIHNPGQQILIILPAHGRCVFKPCIATAFCQLENLAHHLNGKSGAMIVYELVDFPSLLEKMLTAFFKMSLSILASLDIPVILPPIPDQT